MILLMQFYRAHNIRRQRELNECVVNNATRPFIDKLVLFIQGDNAMEEYRSIDFNKDNVITIMTDKQYTYKEFFQYANDNCKGEIVGLCHSDILLKDGFEKIKNIHLYKRIVVAARHELGCNTLSSDRCCLDQTCGEYCGDDPDIFGKTRLYYYRGGFDTYVFQPPLSNDVINKLDYTQNTWHGENRISSVFQWDGYDVVACAQLITYHNDTLGSDGDSPSQAYFPNGYPFHLGSSFFTVGTAKRNFTLLADEEND